MTPGCNHSFVETEVSVGTLVGMNQTTTSEIQTGRRIASNKPDDTVDRSLERRAALRDRHSHGLTRLMEERADLRGVHALADFVDDSVRWTA